VVSKLSPSVGSNLMKFKRLRYSSLMKIIFLTTIAFFLSVTSLCAQAPEIEPVSVTVSFFAFKYAVNHKTIFLKTEEGIYDEITLSTANIVGPFNTYLSEQGEVALYTRKTMEDGIDAYPILARIKISGAIKEPLLILIPSGGKQPYGALAVDRNVEGFPEGSYKLINFSRSDIRGVIGTTTLFAASGKITSFDPSSNSERLLNVVFQYNNDGDWRTFGSTRWVNTPKGRTILCAFYDSKRKRMQIRGIPLR